MSDGNMLISEFNVDMAYTALHMKTMKYVSINKTLSTLYNNPRS